MTFATNFRFLSIHAVLLFAAPSSPKQVRFSSSENEIAGSSGSSSIIADEPRGASNSCSRQRGSSSKLFVGNKLSASRNVAAATYDKFSTLPKSSARSKQKIIADSRSKRRSPPQRTQELLLPPAPPSIQVVSPADSRGSRGDDFAAGASPALNSLLNDLDAVASSLSAADTGALSILEQKLGFVEFRAGFVVDAAGAGGNNEKSQNLASSAKSQQFAWRQRRPVLVLDWDDTLYPTGLFHADTPGGWRARFCGKCLGKFDGRRGNFLNCWQGSGSSSKTQSSSKTKRGAEKKFASLFQSSSCKSRPKPPKAYLCETCQEQITYPEYINLARYFSLVFQFLQSAQEDLDCVIILVSFSKMIAADIDFMLPGLHPGLQKLLSCLCASKKSFSQAMLPETNPLPQHRTGARAFEMLGFDF